MKTTCRNCNHNTTRIDGYCAHCAKLIARWPRLRGSRFCVNCGSGSHNACSFAR